MFKLSSVSLIRKRLMQLGLNPYIKTNKEYYLSLKTYNVLSKLKAKVYGQYNNSCAVCGDSLNNGERIELHHIKPVKEGGKTVKKNLMPLHWMCHVKITHEKIK